MPAMIFKKVDFPAPLRPTKAIRLLLQFLNVCFQTMFPSQNAGAT